MDKITRYIHHGFRVSVIRSQKGLHRDHCLCFQSCARFFPDEVGKNCLLAQALYEFDVRNGMVTPVWECPMYHRRKS